LQKEEGVLRANSITDYNVGDFVVENKGRLRFRHPGLSDTQQVERGRKRARLAWR
jgi:hypothetical protein